MKSYLPLPIPDKLLLSGLPLTRKKYTPAFKAACVRQVAAGARQTDVARVQGLSPASLGRWPRQALAEAVPSSAEREEMKRLRAELKRVEQKRDMLKKVVTIFAQPPQSRVVIISPSRWRPRSPCRCSAACWRLVPLAITSGGGGQADQHLPRSLRPAPPFCAMPIAMAPDACGQNYAPKGTRLGATPCALGYAAAACGR